MTVHESRRYEMFVRITQFREQYQHLFPDGSVGAQALTAVATAAAQLAEQAASKMSTRKEGTHAKEAARAALLDLLDAMERTARRIAVKSPGFDEAFRRPEGRSNTVVLTAGRVFLTEAEAVKDKFIAHGLRATFLDDLKAAHADFEQRTREREVGKNGRTAAQAGIDAALAAGMDAVKTLDVIVRNQLRTDPVTLAVWKRDRRMTAFRGRGPSAALRQAETGTAPADAAAKSSSESAAKSTTESAGKSTSESAGKSSAEPAAKSAVAESPKSATPDVSKPASADAALKVAS